MMNLQDPLYLGYPLFSAFAAVKELKPCTCVLAKPARNIKRRPGIVGILIVMGSIPEETIVLVQFSHSLQPAFRLREDFPCTPLGTPTILPLFPAP